MDEKRERHPHFLNNTKGDISYFLRISNSTCLNLEIQIETMKVKDGIIVGMYQVLGKVFYAAAQADRVIRQEEIDVIKESVRETWLNAEDTLDQFGSDSAYQIEIVIDSYFSGNQILTNALDDLKEFISVHPRLFTPELIELIMKTAYKTASAFAGRNKAELVFLSQLRNLLEQEKP